MTPVPPPDTPCLRVRTIYNIGASGEQGSRFYLAYAGAAPTGANCATIASDIAAAWVAHLAPVVSSDFALEEVDVLDIATDSGLSGQWTGDDAGSAGAPTPLQCAVNVEFDISRRYRGGKPRIYLPAPPQSELETAASLMPSYVTAVNTAVSAFFTAIEALSVGAVGALTHVNLSYYKGFTNITTSSGRERAVPKYRDAALHDNVVGYACKPIIGSQRRRRTATTP